MIEFMSQVTNLLIVMAGVSIIPAFIWATRCAPPLDEEEDSATPVERRIAQLERERSMWP
jgi:hypothetical protein